MEYRRLGSTGVVVSHLALGTGVVGSWGTADRDECVSLVRRAMDSGVNLVDTADGYSNGEAEEIVGKAINGRRDEVVLATKVGGQMGIGRNRAGGSRRWIKVAVEESLRRLDTDYIDLYQVHRRDGTTALDETLSALTDLQREGKIRYFGSSTFRPEEVVEAQWIARDRHLARFVTEQPPYSLLVRGIESGLLPVAQRYAIGIMTYAPLASGWLSGRYRVGVPRPETRRAERMPARFDLASHENQRKLGIVEQLVALADDVGVSLLSLAMSFIAANTTVTSAIIGPRTLDHLDGYLAVADDRIGPDVLDRIEQIVPRGTTVVDRDNGYQNLPPGFPGTG